MTDETKMNGSDDEHDDENPVKQSFKWLVECGWTEQQARHLIEALRCDTPEKLGEIAGPWLQMCGDAKRHMTILECVAMGVVRVDQEDGEWVYSLHEARQE